MSNLTRKYSELLIEAHKIEQAGYHHAQLHHTYVLQQLSADDIEELANGLVLAITETKSPDSLLRAVGMARFYREYAASKRAAA